MFKKTNHIKRSAKKVSAFVPGIFTARRFLEIIANKALERQRTQK